MIYFIRHGERCEQVKRAKTGYKFKNTRLMSEPAREKYYKKLEQSNFYDKLTNRGKKDTEKVAEQFINKNIDLIFCSPFKRCVETAKIIAKKINAPIITDYRLCERGTYNHIRHFEESEFNKHWDNYLNYNFETRHIETCKHFCNRIADFLANIKKEHPNKNILIVGHSCLTYAINTAINGVPKNGFIPHDKIDNTSIRVLNY